MIFFTLPIYFSPPSLLLCLLYTSDTCG